MFNSDMCSASMPFMPDVSQGCRAVLQVVVMMHVCTVCRTACRCDKAKQLLVNDWL